VRRGITREERVAKLADTGGKTRAQARIKLRRLHELGPLEVRRHAPTMSLREAGEP
jgi:hypothetical protein